MDSANIPTQAMHDWVSRVLGINQRSGQTNGKTPSSLFTADTATGTATDGAFVAMQKARLAWDTTRTAIQSQLKSLEDAIVKGVKAHNDDPEQQDKYDLDEVAAASRKLYTLLAPLDTELIDALDDALNASGEQRKQHQARAKDIIINKYQAFATANKKEIDEIDNNGFITTAIWPTLERTLANLSQRL